MKCWCAEALKWFETTEEGLVEVERAGLKEFIGRLEMDHLFPESKHSIGLGLSHVANLYLMIRIENKVFSDRADLWHFKMENIGAVNIFLVILGLRLISVLCVRAGCVSLLPLSPTS